MDSSFHALPPSKRFKLLNSQQPSSDSLPSKQPIESPLPFNTFSSSCCLPAKKRVWAPLPLSPIKHQDEVHANGEADDEEDDDDDDGIVCSVCQSTDGEPLNPIVICDGCELMVHASCYGNPLLKSIPEGDWFCMQCEEKNKSCSTPSCCLCPVKQGALKPTVDGNWAHIVCALLVPEVFFKDSEGRDGIDCSLVPLGRKELGCYVCESVDGCAVECSEPKCGLGFHVSCGLEKGLCFEFKEAKCGAVVAAFCQDHTQLWEKQQLTGKFRIVPRKI
ncbi:protein Jade-1 [Dioscorea cayenensis subsp. rotundata]|uniref:Protein Jade-1 n=1 Tax=Dioscorea cayennensis subsp. rotundata TaxID=55577 RepID=A0AB40CU75_DIOCR|nr:protein Jade-1 [Dioscorea cayenensis subsp. rotundata]